MRLYLLSLGLMLCLTGCHRDGWLSGKWSFDREYTQAHLLDYDEQAKGSDTLSSMKAGLEAMLVPQLLAKLDGSTLDFRGGELIFTEKGGGGKSLTYTVLDRPTSSSVRLKFTDGDVQTYALEGDRLASPSTGDVHFKAYFRRPGQ